MIYILLAIIIGQPAADFVSAMECNPSLSRIMGDTRKGITTEFFVAENEYGQCVQHGEWIETWDTGKIRLKAQYKYGIEYGRWTYYYLNGQRRMTGLYCSDTKCLPGEQFGQWTSWHKNGYVGQEGHYCKNGLQCGRWKQWWSNGNIRSDTTWQNGKLSGRITNYFPNGTIATQGWNETDKKIGKWIWYDNDGNILIEKDFDKKGI